MEVAIWWDRELFIGVNLVDKVLVVFEDVGAFEFEGLRQHVICCAPFFVDQPFTFYGFVAAQVGIDGIDYALWSVFG